MECPRCGGTVTVYRLRGRESFACDDCEYVGIEVEHGSERRPSESWATALSRFRGRESSEERRDTDDAEAAAEDERTEDVSHDGVPSAARAVRDLDVPGGDVTRAQRRAAIQSLYEALRTRGEATREELLTVVDPETVGYESSDAFWTDIGRDRLASLPGVQERAADDGVWRFDADAATEEPAP
jgi:hypothetical protein